MGVQALRRLSAKRQNLGRAARPERQHYARKKTQYEDSTNQIDLLNHRHAGAGCRRHHQVKALVDHAVETHGRIDVLVNNAGLMPHSPLERGKIEDWDRMIDVNMVKFQQRYQMRNRILAKAVPALEFRSFCNSQKCVPSYSGRCNSLRY